MDDIRAVMDAAGIERAHLADASEGGLQSVLFAATYRAVRSMTLRLVSVVHEATRLPVGQGDDRQRVQRLV